MIDYIIPTIEIIEYSLEDVIAGSKPKDPYDVTQPFIEGGATSDEITGGGGSNAEDYMPDGPGSPGDSGDDNVEYI